MVLNQFTNFSLEQRVLCKIYIDVGVIKHMCGSRGGQGARTSPLENYKNIGFLSNIGSDPLKITKLPIQHSMLGHHRHASETPSFVWGAVDDPLIVVLDPFSPHQAKTKQNKRKQKKVEPPLTKLSGSAHEIVTAWYMSTRTGEYPLAKARGLSPRPVSLRNPNILWCFQGWGSGTPVPLWIRPWTLSGTLARRSVCL